MFGFSFGFSFGDFGLRLVEDRSTSRFSFGLRSVYFWSAFGLPPAIVQYTYDLRSVYVMILVPLFVQATSNLRSICVVYARSTLGLHSVYVRI